MNGLHTRTGLLSLDLICGLCPSRTETEHFSRAISITERRALEPAGDPRAFWACIEDELTLSLWTMVWTFLRKPLRINFSSFRGRLPSMRQISKCGVWDPIAMSNASCHRPWCGPQAWSQVDHRPGHPQSQHACWTLSRSNIFAHTRTNVDMSAFRSSCPCAHSSSSEKQLKSSLTLQCLTDQGLPFLANKVSRQPV